MSTTDSNNIFYVIFLINIDWLELETYSNLGQGQELKY